MAQTEYDWHAAESRAQVACEAFNEKQPAARDAALSQTKSGELIGYLKITSSELAADAGFKADYDALVSAVEAAGFTVTNTEDRATDGFVERVLTLDLEPTLRAEFERKQAEEVPHADERAEG